VLLLTLGMSTSAFAAGAGPEASQAGPVVKSEPNVLFLSSYSPDWFEVSMQMQGLQDALEKRRPTSSSCSWIPSISVQPRQSSTCAHLKALCSETHFNAVVVGDDAALDFAMKYRPAFFAMCPLYSWASILPKPRMPPLLYR
jgi:hypothetical protein